MVREPNKDELNNLNQYLVSCGKNEELNLVNSQYAKKRSLEDNPLHFGLSVIWVGIWAISLFLCALLAWGGWILILNSQNYLLFIPYVAVVIWYITFICAPVGFFEKFPIISHGGIVLCCCFGYLCLAT